MAASINHITLGPPPSTIPIFLASTSTPRSCSHKKKKQSERLRPPQPQLSPSYRHLARRFPDSTSSPTKQTKQGERLPKPQLPHSKIATSPPHPPSKISRFLPSAASYRRLARPTSINNINIIPTPRSCSHKTNQKTERLRPHIKYPHEARPHQPYHARPTDSTSSPLRYEPLPNGKSKCPPPSTISRFLPQLLS